MRFTDVLRAASLESGVSLRAIGQAVGRAPAYGPGVVSRGTDPSTATAAALIEPCGYVLAAVPASQPLPPGSMVIDPRPAG
mgnify:CR=1 FL=1